MRRVGTRLVAATHRGRNGSGRKHVGDAPNSGCARLALLSTQPDTVAVERSTRADRRPVRLPELSAPETASAAPSRSFAPGQVLEENIVESRFEALRCAERH
jgi:hypothetical protein